MAEIVKLRKCPHCGGMNYSRLRDCLLCRTPLVPVVEGISEQATIREGKGHEHLVMFLEVISGPVKGETFQLRNGLVLGRSNKVDVQIMSEEASRKHAEIILDEHERWLLRDLGSANGTFHNGKEIDAHVILKPADKIQIGEGVFKIKGGGKW